MLAPATGHGGLAGKARSVAGSKYGTRFPVESQNLRGDIFMARAADLVYSISLANVAPMAAAPRR